MLERTNGSPPSDAKNARGSETMATDSLNLGKGLDVGTTNLVAAFEDEHGDVVINLERNAFLDIKSDPFTRSMLSKQKIPYAVHKDSLYVLGQSSFEFANIVGREVRRPMSDGTISPTEADALPVVRLLVEKLLGPPRHDKEPLCISVPASPVDMTMNVDYHTGILLNLGNRMGYQALAIPEGLAVVYSELGDQEFSGIGISFGGGMANVCIAYKSVPAIAFSVGRSGDWIDRNAAQVLGSRSSRITLLKERGLNLASPKSREEEAIVIFYRNLLHYVADKIYQFMVTSKAMPEFPGPVELVCSGGTTLVTGFLEVLQDEFSKIDFPIPIKVIRIAEDPLNSTVRGCMLAAISST